MKTLLVLALMISSGSAFAFETLSCKGNEQYGTPASVTLDLSAQRLTINDVAEGFEVPYDIVIKDKGDVIANTIVHASQEDVEVFLVNVLEDIQGKIYLDEYEQTSVTVKGTKYNFDCN